MSEPGVAGGFARVPLGHWPTPLEPCNRLRDEIGGPLVWLKRDDCSGLALGGNKTRKLEYLLGDALEQKATAVVTFGALQSNHARQTAAACARLGLPCDLILTETVDRRSPHYLESGNRLLDDLLGATVHVVADGDEALGVAAELAHDTGRYFIDPGGSTPVGTLGYVTAAAELAEQVRERDLSPGRVVSAASTGGTAAGLAVGLEQAGLGATVEAVAVYASAEVTRAAITRLTEATAGLLGVATNGDVEVDDTTLGPGYGVSTPESRAAIELLARTEGVLLDPVYTAKAFAHLVDRLPRWESDADVVFVHTGGQAGLFAYADDH